MVKYPAYFYGRGFYFTLTDKMKIKESIFYFSSIFAPNPNCTLTTEKPRLIIGVFLL
jgi:hypothetical protein